MTNEKRPQKTFVVAWCCVGLLLVSNGLLTYRVRMMSRWLAESAEETKRAREIPIGTPVPSVAGYGPQGNRVELDTASSSATIVMVFSPYCGHCEDAWPLWGQLVAGVTQNKDIRPIFVDATSSVSLDYMLSHPVLAGQMLVTRVDPSTMAGFRLNFIPQTILVGSTGTVVRVWSGPMTALQVKEAVELAARSGS